MNATRLLVHMRACAKGYVSGLVARVVRLVLGRPRTSLHAALPLDRPIKPGKTLRGARAQLRSIHRCELISYVRTARFSGSLFPFSCFVAVKSDVNDTYVYSDRCEPRVHVIIDIGQTREAKADV